MHLRQVLDAIYRVRYGLVLAGSIALYLILSLRYYLGAGWDDQFITLWQGEQLAAGHGLVNYNGEPVEISSSLLHTLITAAIALADSQHVFLWNKVLGLFAGAAVLTVLYGARRSLFPGLGRRHFTTYAAATALTASTPCFLYWNLGGLEAPYVALLLTAYGALLESHWRTPSLSRDLALGCVAALFVLTRPEGFYLVLFAVLHLALYWALRGRRLSAIFHVLIPLMAFLGATLWRVRYFGALFPNPVYAKRTVLVEQLIDGALYVEQFVFSSISILLCCAIVVLAGARLATLLVVSAGRAKRPEPAQLQGMFAAGLIVTVLMVVAAVGGDWMSHFRFLAPVTPLLITLAVSQAARLGRGLLARWPQRSVHLCVSVAASVALAGLLLAHQRQDGTVAKRGKTLKADYVRASYPMPDFLGGREALQNQVMRLCPPVRRDLDALEEPFDNVLPAVYAQTGRLVIVTHQMGFFPYMLKKRFPDWNIRLVDMSGLTDPYIARGIIKRSRDPALRGAWRIENVLAGKAPDLSEYVLEQRPNMVYVLGLSLNVAEFSANLARLGFDCVASRPGGHLYFRSESAGGT